MHRINFPEWPQALRQAEVPERQKRSFEITIRWYLSFCRRARADVTVQSARDFIDCVTREKQPANLATGAMERGATLVLPVRQGVG